MNKLFISRILIDKDNNTEFPFTLPIIKNTKQIGFDKRVTFFFGENGTGKSTMLEGIAVAYGFNPEGGSKNFTFSTAKTHSDLFEHITIVKESYPKTCFFLRAESFYNLASNIDYLDENTGQILDNYGGVSLHDQSHGESFMSVFCNRFKNNGLYILDEPEAALSPMKQITLLKLISGFAKNNSQFIIASHSPILLALPDADIYSFDESRIKKIKYEETEHYIISKYFYLNRERYIDLILNG